MTLSQLLERRVIFLLGKGGVGKSTLSAGLAMCAAQQGVRALLMETDSRAPLASILGVKRSFSPIHVAGISGGDRISSVTSPLSTMVLEGGHALEEYLALVLPGRAMLKAVSASKIYHFFVQAAPGLRELMILGKVCYEVTRTDQKHDRWDLIIVDAPASGQALSLLKMPSAAHATFGASIVGKEADNINRMLRDRKLCALVEVTTPETLAVTEIIETHRGLAALDLRPAAAFLNCAREVGYDSHDVAVFGRRIAATGQFRHSDHMMEIAEASVSRSAETPKAQAELARHMRMEVIKIPEFQDESERQLLDRVASFFSSILNTAQIHPSETRAARQGGRHA